MEDYQGASYASGRVHSAGKDDVLYGRFEVRARLPRGQGTWPAIWILPSDPYRYSTTCKKGEDWQGSATCDAWPYDHPFHLILNIAVGGVWGRAGGPIDDTIFPQRMLVDYVRVYQKAGE